MLSAVDVEYCDGLVDFLRDEYHSVHGKLKMNRKGVYLSFSAALNLAVENGLIRRNPLFFVKIHDRITRERPEKLHLSVTRSSCLWTPNVRSYPSAGKAGIHALCLHRAYRPLMLLG